MDMRELKALELAARAKIVYDDGVWSVPSQTGGTKYRVTLSPVTLSPEEQGKLAAEGAVYVSRSRSVHFVESPGETPGGAALRSLGAILSAVRGPV